MTQPPPPTTCHDNGDEFFRRIRHYLSSEDIQSVEKAFQMAKDAHGDEKRKSGELFFTHPVTVANYLAEYYLDAPTLIAALLHDVAEDTKITIQEIENEFDEEISQLVDGVTKLKSEDDDVVLTKQEIIEGTLIKLLKAMTDDVRVVLIKIFDRLHNTRTMASMPLHKQKEKSEETLSIYARLANRLGMWDIKNELEYRSLEILDPQSYIYISQILEKQSQEHQKHFPKIKSNLIKNLQNIYNIDVVDIIHHPRNIYSIYKDLQDPKQWFEDIDNALRITVLVKNKMACYQALGRIHQLWSPVPQTFDDYIAVPRDNLYRSLHTTVVHKTCQTLKLHIRTPKMNLASRIGVLAKWYNTHTSAFGQGAARQIDTFLKDVRGLIELELRNIAETIKGFQDNFLVEQINVFTPNGDIWQFPKGATPLDFAYKVHSAVGNHCQTAFIGGRFVPLNYPLKNGDQVTIGKKDSAEPQRIWLDEHLGYMVTQRAKEQVRHWFRKQDRATILAQGCQLLENELAMLGLEAYEHDVIARRLGYARAENLCMVLGNTELTPSYLAVRLLKGMWSTLTQKRVGNAVTTKDGVTYLIISAEHHDLRLCRTCKPVPGNRIVGYLRADGGATVHCESCKSLARQTTRHKRLRLGWGKLGQTDLRIIAIRVDIYDRKEIVHEITGLFKEEGINIDYLEMPRDTARKHLEFGLETSGAEQVVHILHRIGAMDNVYGVRCLLPALPAFSPPDLPSPETK